MDAKERGTRIVVIDPFFSQTAAKADQWIPIMPGTDGAMALAMANVIISKDLYDKDFVSRFVLGFEEFKQHVQQYTPEWAAKITAVPTDVIVNLEKCCDFISGRICRPLPECRQTTRFSFRVGVHQR